jgi:hypothetical protein
VVVLDVTARIKGAFRREYLVLRLGPTGGTRARFSLRRTIYGDNLLADVRIGPDGRLYRLGSSPAAGARIDPFRPALTRSSPIHLPSLRSDDSASG